jgi:xanthine dehydrogenase accessory factor
MREILDNLIESLDAGRAVACCRLVETRGSTPQKPGATMLVLADGSQIGTLGGGCVEAEVKRRALAVMAEGEAQVVKFTLDDDYGWDDGLICGGRMQVLIDPLRDEPSQRFVRRLRELIHNDGGATEAIVFDAEASGLTAASIYLFDAEGRLDLTLRTASAADDVPPMVCDHLRPHADRPRASANQGVAYLPHLGLCRLLIVGGGHIGQAVADLAADLDFEVTVVDDREEYVSSERFPKAVRRVTAPIAQSLADEEITPDTYCLIVTRGHNHDEEALFHLADRGARYVGMIGSRRKIRLIYDDLLAEGVSPAALEKVHAPVGLDIGSQTVPEIAVSIAAELVAHRNCDGQVPGRPEAISFGESG